MHLYWKERCDSHFKMKNKMLKLFSSIYKRNFASFKKIISELYNIKSAPLLKGSSDMMVISLEDELALYPPPYTFFICWYNRKGHKCRRYDHVAPGGGLENVMIYRLKACIYMVKHWQGLVMFDHLIFFYYFDLKTYYNW